MGPDIVDLLSRSRVPIGPVGSKWEHQTEFGWSWPKVVRDFVLTRG